MAFGSFFVFAGQLQHKPFKPNQKERSMRKHAWMAVCLVATVFFLGKFRFSCSTSRKVDRYRRYDRNEDRPGEEGSGTGYFR
jgi:hypothetical protein